LREGEAQGGVKETAPVAEEEEEPVEEEEEEEEEEEGAIEEDGEEEVGSSFFAFEDAASKAPDEDDEASDECVHLPLRLFHGRGSSREDASFGRTSVKNEGKISKV
jgi:hypothetical protein